MSDDNPLLHNDAPPFSVSLAAPLKIKIKVGKPPLSATDKLFNSLSKDTYNNKDN